MHMRTAYHSHFFHYPRRDHTHALMHAQVPLPPSFYEFTLEVAAIAPSKVKAMVKANDQFTAVMDRALVTHLRALV